MKLNESKHKDLIVKYFDYSGDFDFLDLVADTLEGIDDFSNEEDVYYACDNAYIYYADQWTIARHYNNSPFQMDGEQTRLDFEGDIQELARQIAKGQ